MHLVTPPNICITIALDFSWDDCNTQEKLETMAMQNFGGVNKVHYGLCESSETIRKPKVSTKIFCTEINFFLRTPAEISRVC